MRIGDIERVGERQIPMPMSKPQAPQVKPTPSPLKPRREREEPEKVS
jgi:hypothetical protein